MNPYSKQLCDGADEVAQYLRNHATEAGVEPHSYRRLADQMVRAAQIDDQPAAERVIRGIARMIVDEFPLTDEFAPSFSAALLAVQHAERRRRRKPS